MFIGLFIIIVFPFIYFYTQASNLNTKVSAIRKAVKEGKETYTDPLTGKTHWTENGEQVIWTEILSVERKIPEGCIVGDQVLRGVKSGRVYKNRSYDQFIAHIQRQMDDGKEWCWERSVYNEKSRQDYDYKYNMKGKYFYSLHWDHDAHNYYIQYYDTKKTEPISFERYRELGGLEWNDRTRGYRK